MILPDGIHLNNLRKGTKYKKEEASNPVLFLKTKSTLVF